VKSASSQLVAAVTGASRGIGRSTALLLAREGYRVFALARSEGDLQTLAAESGGVIETLTLDIADDESRRRAIRAIMSATGDYGLDVLVNNAGYGLLGPLEEVTADDLRRQLEVNVVGLHDFTRPFLPSMRQRRRGWIVNVSSAAGRVATPFMGAYHASKFALEGMSDSLRRELRPFGVRVILVEPGPIKTDFSHAAVRAGGPASPYAAHTRRWNGARRSSDVWGRSPDVVARVILKSLRSAHPKARYTVTVSARMGTVAHRLVPDRLLDWIFARGIGKAV
jgi:short-subunit dehydrogenase